MKFSPSTTNRRLAAHLKRGGVIAYPTESCYGLGCDPSNRRAVHGAEEFGYDCAQELSK